MSNHKNINTNAKKKQLSQMSIMTFLSQKTKKDKKNTADEDTDKDLLTDNNTNNNANNNTDNNINNNNDNTNIKDNNDITNTINNTNSANNITNPINDSDEPNNNDNNTNNNNNTSNTINNNDNDKDIPMTNISETKPTQQQEQPAQPLNTIPLQNTPPTITEPIIAYATKILGKKRKDTKTFYKIDWSDPSEPSWVPSSLIIDTPIIDIYNHTYTKPTPTSDLYIGSFQNGDTPNEILYRIPSLSYSNDIAVLVSWKRRKNGTIPNNSICYLSELKRTSIHLVIKYLEKHLLFLSP